MTDNEIFISGKLGSKILIINKADIPYIGSLDKGLEVMTIQVDLKKREIFPPLELEKHLKFNPWEETTEQDRAVLSQLLYSRFSDKDILEKICLPLAENLIQD